MGIREGNNDEKRQISSEVEHCPSPECRVNGGLRINEDDRVEKDENVDEATVGVVNIGIRRINESMKGPRPCCVDQRKHTSQNQ